MMALPLPRVGSDVTRIESLEMRVEWTPSSPNTTASSRLNNSLSHQRSFESELLLALFRSRRFSFRSLFLRFFSLRSLFADFSALRRSFRCATR